MNRTQHFNRPGGGFTLAEILVAMTIFVILMSGVMVMFSSAVTSVRETYARKDTFETGRSALDVLTRDLESAFNAREHGDVYNFYGTPNGFMFVGTLEGGDLGRVTYVLRNMGQIFETNALSIADAAAGNAAGHTERRVRYALIRYEERGVTNLDDFPLPSGYQWPKLDPVFAIRDRPTLTGTIESPLPLYAELVRAVRNPDGTDLRDMILAAKHSGGGVEGLHAVDEQFVRTLIAARKRQIWIDMLAGEGPFQNELAGGLRAYDYFALLIAQQGYELADFSVAEDLLAVVESLDPNGDPLLDLNGFPRLTRPFFTYAGPDGSRVAYFNTLENFDFPNLDNATKQRYFADLQQLGYQRSFTEYSEFRSKMTPIYLLSFDDTLARVLSGKRGTATALGLPLLPKLPALVEPNFMVGHPPQRVGAPFYSRNFSQAIQVPTGFSRGLPPSLAPSPS